MTKEFIPYQQALALKELGFDEPCIGFYSINNEYFKDGYFHMSTENPFSKDIEPMNQLLHCVLAPLYQQAFRWFREKHRLCCQFSYYHSSKWGFEILEFTDLKITPNKEITDFNKPRTYEEAELECLQKLIELCCM